MHFKTYTGICSTEQIHSHEIGKWAKLLYSVMLTNSSKY